MGKEDKVLLVFKGLNNKLSYPFAVAVIQEINGISRSESRSNIVKFCGIIYLIHINIYFILWYVLYIFVLYFYFFIIVSKIN